MSYPLVSGSALSTDTVSDTNHTISLPASIAAGDLILVFFHGSGTDAVPNSAITGFTRLRDIVHKFGVGHATGFYKIAAGGEGPTVTATTDVAERTAAIALRITNWHGTTPPEASTGATADAGDNAPDPDTVAPSWMGDSGTSDNLYIAYAGSDGQSTDFTAFPASYTSNQLETANSGEGRSALATRNSPAASENPGPFTTVNSSLNWSAFTVAVRSGTGGGGTKVPGKLGLLGVG